MQSPPCDPLETPGRHTAFCDLLCGKSDVQSCHCCSFLAPAVSASFLILCRCNCCSCCCLLLLKQRKSLQPPARCSACLDNAQSKLPMNTVRVFFLFSVCFYRRGVVMDRRSPAPRFAPDGARPPTRQNLLLLPSLKTFCLVESAAIARPSPDHQGQALPPRLFARELEPAETLDHHYPPEACQVIDGVRAGRKKARTSSSVVVYGIQHPHLAWLGISRSWANADQLALTCPWPRRAMLLTLLVFFLARGQFPPRSSEDRGICRPCGTCPFSSS